MFLNLRQIHAEDIFAFTQSRRFQNLITLQGSIGLNFNLAELIIRVFEEKTPGSESNTEIETNGKAGKEHNLRSDHKDPSIPMLSRLMGANFYIEEMLLAALSRIR